MTNSWYYREMGSRDKKGNLKYYQVRVTDYKIDDCELWQDNLDLIHLVNT